MRDGKTYEIRSVADFFAVPEDRRALCLLEFGMWMAVIDKARVALAGILLADPGETFIWVDDDKGDATFQFKDGAGTVLHEETHSLVGEAGDDA